MNKDKDNMQLLLGKEVSYTDSYSPHLLFAIDRQGSRESIGLDACQLPFTGVDIWNAYELSWLDTKGKPQVACAEFRVPCESPSIIESKSFKLYLNSLNQSRFNTVHELQQLLETDLSSCAGSRVDVLITPFSVSSASQLFMPEGYSLDDLDVTIEDYSPNPVLLNIAGSSLAEEKLYSHLLRSLCPVTGQPDWATVLIHYSGPLIDHSGLLKYLISFRQHPEFHEQCVERIFNDISIRCAPSQLSVYARYVRRGGLDINPFRSSSIHSPENLRLSRQ